MTPKRLRELISRTHRRGVQIHHEINELTAVERSLEALNRRRREILLKVGTPITMYDSVTISAIPSPAVAVAGYVGGLYPTYEELKHKFPHARVLSIAVNASENAECLDVEKGDATPLDIPDWVRRQQKRGIRKPVIYADLSMMPGILIIMRQHGIRRDEICLWVAHYTGVASIPAGFDACQYWDKALGRNLDVSLCLPTFFDR